MSSIEAIKSLGVNIKSEEQVKKELGNTDDIKHEIKPPVFNVRGGDRQMAVKLGLIPEAYANVEFDVDHIKENITAQSKASARKFKVVKFNNYISTLNSILSSIRTGSRPDCSYIIGAPNGFGKTSFVNTCIKVMYAQGMKAVPYISLTELAELRAENEKSLLKGVSVKARKSLEGDEGENSYAFSSDSDYMKMPKVITGMYSWSEYINSDILFCFFSSIDSKVIESHTLKGLLEIRGAKGLPTVVFIATSIDPYRIDYNLREFVWDEILAYKEDTNCFDRVYHVSCYKRANNTIGDNDLAID